MLLLCRAKEKAIVLILKKELKYTWLLLTTKNDDGRIIKTAAYI